MTSISQMCREAGIDRKTYYNRRKRGGKDLFKPTKYNRLSKEIIKALEENGISRVQYCARIHKGWSEWEASHVPVNADQYLYYNGKTVHSQLTPLQYGHYRNLYYYKGEDIANKYLERKLNEQRV